MPRAAGEPNTHNEPPSFAAYRELTKQILTLATGILALTLTFVKDFVEALSTTERWFLVGAWALYILSIGFGVLTMMALAGAQFCVENPDNERCKGLPKPVTIYADNVRTTSYVQVVTFFLATVALVVVGALEA